MLLLCCLVINEIAFAPADPALEYVELLNVGIETVEMAQIEFYDSRLRPVRVSSRSLLLEPGGYLVLVRDADAFATAFPGVPFVAVSPWPALNNGGDRPAVGAGGREIDAVPYDGDWGGPVLERHDPRGPSDHRVNWTSAAGSPGQRNAAYRPDREPPEIVFSDRLHTDTVWVQASEPVLPVGRLAGSPLSWVTDRTGWAFRPPGLTLSGLEDLFGNTAPTVMLSPVPGPMAGDVLVSERLVRPSPLIELWNRSDQARSLRRTRVGDRTLGPVSLRPGAAMLVADPPGGSEEVEIRDAYGALVDTASFDADLLDPALPPSGTSLHRLPDGRWYADQPTPGTHSPLVEVAAPAEGTLVINEVLFHAEPGGVEFVELLALELVELNEVYLRIDRYPATPDSVRIAWRPTAAAAGTLITLVFPVSGVAAADLPWFAQRAYPDGGGIWLHAAGAPSLRNDGVRLSLHRRDGLLLDHVELTPDLHAADLRDPAGISLERVDARAPADAPGNWRSSAATRGASPGEGRAQSPSPESGGLQLVPQVFDPSETSVRITVPGAASVHARVFDRRGRAVRTLAGLGQAVFWDGRDESGRRVRNGIHIVLARGESGRSYRGVVVVASR
ncbi:MAG: hypothetical protein JJ896_16345 [Rhodothermales bacterium]|nr:hypothetical protein [Rhodothermales bacterium]MBO6781227.1 hypothetical protein [Rhodothermales bacterium]